MTFEEHWAKDRARLLAFSRGLARDLEMADDLLQIGRIKAWSAFGNFDGASAFGTWVMRIIYRTFLDIRKRKQFEVLSLDSPVEGTDGITLQDALVAGGNFEDGIISADVVIGFVSALPNASDRDLLARLMFEQTCAEISDGMSIGIGAVRSRIHRLRDHLSKHPHFSEAHTC